jgi:hypothetical protein
MCDADVPGVDAGEARWGPVTCSKPLCNHRATAMHVKVNVPRATAMHVNVNVPEIPLPIEDRHRVPAFDDDFAIRLTSASVSDQSRYGAGLVPEPVLLGEDGTHLRLDFYLLRCLLEPKLQSTESLVPWAQSHQEPLVRAYATWSLRWFSGALARIETPPSWLCSRAWRLVSPPEHVRQPFLTAMLNNGNPEPLYAFHGTPVERLYSICNQGLRVSTPENGLLLHGQAYGAACYCTPLLHVAASYSSRGRRRVARVQQRSAAFVFVCQVVPGEERQHNHGIWTVRNENMILPRLLLEFNGERPFHSILSAQTPDLRAMLA